MKIYPERKLNRLDGYDYAQSGWYFVTMVTKGRECNFGTIHDGMMQLSDIGTMADACWRNIPIHFPDVTLDEFVVMPNHIHGIIVINNDFDEHVGNENVRSLRNYHSLWRHDSIIPWCGAIPRSLPSIIRGFKIGVTTWCREQAIDFGWQKSFHDRIIRNDYHLECVRQYIRNNPMQWEIDRNHGNKK